MCSLLWNSTREWHTAASVVEPAHELDASNGGKLPRELPQRNDKENARYETCDERTSSFRT